MMVLHLPKVDDINMEFHIDMYFRQFWNDPRLAFSNIKNANVGKVKNIKNARLKTRVWLPDPFFVNQKEGRVLDNPSDNTIFKIEADGMSSVKKSESEFCRKIDFQKCVPFCFIKF